MFHKRKGPYRRPEQCFFSFQNRAAEMYIPAHSKFLVMFSGIKKEAGRSRLISVCFEFVLSFYFRFYFLFQFVLTSSEIVTEFTLQAERQTSFLSGIPINTNLTQIEQILSCEFRRPDNRQNLQAIHQINIRSLQLLNEFIQFKENILNEVSAGRLFTFNYPLLVEHILREARLYRSAIDNIINDRPISCEELYGTEAFWNQIMMEHALFIRGLLDPSEEELINTAADFAEDYKRLLAQAKTQDAAATRELTGKTLDETLKYRDFKASGTQGILNRKIASIILPLLSDHVLREANHYIRILKCIHVE